MQRAQCSAIPIVTCFAKALGSPHRAAGVRNGRLAVAAREFQFPESTDLRGQVKGPGLAPSTAALAPVN